MFYVVRPPCLMEDEGRTEMIGHFPSKELAKKKIEELTKLSKGYFRHSNYKILEA